ncbi:hypothetical protein CJ030_MR0G015624 [Morella rubra]|uniref:Proteasome adapter and scaffold protein ECM29 HEAT-repeat domain-containing protein n=1 Tax=Morella rubra TaxID=262757 RepID=A0A6A1UHQ3_9ROSI|nr:hypothetical protein CJ030_MR0G015624 [Morella rubra]
MLIFMSEELLDVDSYILVMTIWTFVIDSFEVYVGYEPQWYLKEPPTNPIPLVEDFELVDFNPTLLYEVPPPLAPPVEGIGENEIIDLTSDTESRGAGIALRPHLADLVCCMLESLSSLEDQGLNYVELHAANVGIKTEKLENLRISIAKGSPMWETLDLCIKVVDAESLDPLVPRLAQLVRSGVGLNTRFVVT